MLVYDKKGLFGVCLELRKRFMKKKETQKNPAPKNRHQENTGVIIPIGIKHHSRRRTMGLSQLSIPEQRSLGSLVPLFSAVTVIDISSTIR
jgi:hypothetical protein